MAQQHLDPTAGPRGRGRPRGLSPGPGHGVPPRAAPAPRDRRRDRGDGANGSEEAVDAARALRRSARRISGTPAHLPPSARRGLVRGACAPNWPGCRAPWPASTRTGPAWSGCWRPCTGCRARRRSRPRPADSRRAVGAARTPAPAARTRPSDAQAHLTVGAAKAGALLERQLTLARTRAHSAALQALGSSRFHAVADNVAVLASEVPLTAVRVRHRPEAPGRRRGGTPRATPSPGCP